eukprot:TRINITY_DN45267_c0_g2_i1.p1 TRINITY_DN45267_c0_g2~~TRINITY_DN45267_c0_g2_i1.p1  ORF type:complete len:216 (-),score=75.19 TRINITY_DN45267_c0_g2_i1:248-895(-)
MADVMAVGEPVSHSPAEVPAAQPGAEAAAAEAAAENAADADWQLDAEELELMKQLKAWAGELLAAEIARVEACGQRIQKLAVKNCGIVRPDSGSLINRVEVETEFDFDVVQQIMLSEPSACPLDAKKGFYLRFVVLYTGKPTLLILPYLYDAAVVGTSLQDWEFVNKNMQSSRHHVDSFVDAAEEEEKEAAPQTKQQLAAAAAARRSKPGGRRRR